MANSNGLLTNKKIVVENNTIIEICDDNGRAGNMMAFPNVIDLCWLDDTTIKPPAGFHSIVIPSRPENNLPIKKQLADSNAVIRLSALSKRHLGKTPENLGISSMTKKRIQRGVSHWLDPWSNLDVIAGCYKQAQLYDYPVFFLPVDCHYANTGIIHEGQVSFELGLRGMPRISETIPLVAAITCTKQQNNALHIIQLSAKESIDICNEAKKNNSKLTNSVSIFHILFNNTYIKDYRSQYKLMPPLREASDQQAIIKALNQGEIDTITSSHSNPSLGEKKIPFTNSVYGSMSSSWMVLELIRMAQAGILDWSKIASAISVNPAKVINSISTDIHIGNKANFCLIDFNKTTKITTEDCKSPLANQVLKGAIIETIRTTS